MPIREKQRSQEAFQWLLVVSLLLISAGWNRCSHAVELDSARTWTEAELDTLFDGKWFWYDSRYSEIPAIEYTEFDSSDNLPERSSYSKPSYPDVAKKMLTSGEVVLRLLIDHRGKLRYARILRDSGSRFGFEESAMKLVRNCKWKPAQKDGKPVSIWMDYRIDFRLVREDDKEPITMIGPWDYWVGSESKEAYMERWPALKDVEPSVPVDTSLPAPDSITAPIKIDEAQPWYPPRAENSKIEADLWISVLVDVDGRVKRALVQSCSVGDWDFELPALASAIETKWKPAKLHGKPVPIYVSYQVMYRVWGRQ